MLRVERANRRITHPHASYTSDGKLLCNLCEILVKSGAQWQSHLHSTQHNLRSQRAHEASTARGVDSGSKKRKAERLESPRPQEERKKARPAVEEDDDEHAVSPAKATVAGEETSVAGEVSTAPPNGTTHAQPESSAREIVDEAEFAAFEQELADLEAAAATVPPQSALNASATISAAPMSAEEVAAQAREEQSVQRGRRDMELEEEREDAARVLEEEFEEMGALEERVKRLRERREALRAASPQEEGLSEVVKVDGQMVNGDAAGSEEGESEDDEYDDDDDDDEWRFGGS